MQSHKQLVEAYFDGFRRSDHDAILDLLTEDVVWDLYGHRRLEGKEAPKTGKSRMRISPVLRN